MGADGERGVEQQHALTRPPDRSPLRGTGTPRSDWRSLKMLASDGGNATPLRTEKHSPWAWPGPW